MLLVKCSLKVVVIQPLLSTLIKILGGSSIRLGVLKVCWGFVKPRSLSWILTFSFSRSRRGSQPPGDANATGIDTTVYKSEPDQKALKNFKGAF